MAFSPILSFHEIVFIQVLPVCVVIHEATLRVIKQRHIFTSLFEIHHFLNLGMKF